MNIIEKLGITKAPWRVAKDGLGNKGHFPTVYATNNDLNYVCCVCRDYLTVDPVDNLINAQLIAVAPEMLEALVKYTLHDSSDMDKKEIDILRKKQFKQDTMLSRVKENILLIEKATDKSWEKIKALLK